MDAFWQELWRRADANAGRFLGAVVILLIGLLALRYLTTPFRRLLERSRLEPSLVTVTWIQEFVAVGSMARIEMASPGQKLMSDHLSRPSSSSNS